MSSERRGRPRSEAARAAILTAARDLVIDRGYDGLTVAGIAQRAGAGVQTIYRWWPDKAAIIAECVLDNVVVIDIITAHDTGDAAADLRSWLAESSAELNKQPAAALFRALSVAAGKDAAIAERLDAQLGEPLRAALKKVVASGIASGQFRDDINPDAMADVLVGAMMNSMVTGRANASAWAADIANIILGGLLVR
jgi:AcrR family transcriptional regulator